MNATVTTEEAMTTERTSYWCSYECLATEDCRSRCIVFDMRIDLSEADDEDLQQLAKCPRCGVTCMLRDQWPADPGGYGSRGGYDEVLRSHDKQYEELAAFRAALNDRDPTAVAAVYAKLAAITAAKVTST